ncbi:MAG: hypothetical protein AAF432_10290 [Planctomycetota bacterium]
MSDEGSATTQDFLLQFVADRDVECPRCSYNLRDLQRPVCPECEEALVLRVGAERLLLLPYLITMAPHMFCAILTLIVLCVAVVLGPPANVWQMWLFGGFAVTSGLVGIWLLERRWPFMRMSVAAQQLVAMLTWVVHGAMIVFFLALL